jgi:DNA-damage-inducible protein J
MADVCIVAKENRMKTGTISIKVDPQTKDEAGQILEKLGLNISTLVTMMLKQVVHLKGIPFVVKLPDESELTLRAIEQLEAGKGVKFNNANDLLKDLKS